MTATTTLEAIKKAIEEEKTRSAWSRGVKEYALEMIEELQERSEYEGQEPEDLTTLKNYLLNGADSWSQASWGGSYLIYDGDIAERLCTPSELKQTRNGERRPNSQEEWLDVQARALNQAAHKITAQFRRITK